MPNFSAKPPVEELYDPANVVGIYLGTHYVSCIKGTFKEDVVEVPSPYEGGRPELKQMFELRSFDGYSGPGSVRVIGSSSTIIAVSVHDDL